jgi:hypothetical protein
MDRAKGNEVSIKVHREEGSSELGINPTSSESAWLPRRVGHNTEIPNTTTLQVCIRMEGCQYAIKNNTASFCDEGSRVLHPDVLAMKQSTSISRIEDSKFMQVDPKIGIGSDATDVT